MSGGPSNNQREFYCAHCHGKILIPRDLPPTTGPCPHCGQSITSPALELPEAPVAIPQVAAVTLLPAVPVTVVQPIVVEPPVAREAPAVEAPVSLPQPEVQQALAVPVDAIPAAIPVPAGYMPQGIPAPVIQPEPVRQAANPDEPPPLPTRRVRSASVGQEPTRAARPKDRNASLLVPIVVMLALLLVAAGVWVYFSHTSFKPETGPPDFEATGRLSEEAYFKDGWRKDAAEVLNHFLEADTPEKKAAYVLNGKQQLPAMQAFYGSRKVDDSDTPALAFAGYPLPDSDRKRGMFMMMYDQPAQLKLKESFYPISTMELQNGLEDPDMLLSAAASASNFSSEQVKVQALFKRTPDGLKLDWPTFVQTKYRLFRDFVDLPAAGHSAVFRVLIQEDVPEKGRTTQGVRSYKVFDPGNVTDYARVNVPVDSDMGRSLSDINWIGTKSARMDWRTATVELGWSTEETPQLILKRFICWEFLGLGGDAVAPEK